jgi:hypothetical protein
VAASPRRTAHVLVMRSWTSLDMDGPLPQFHWGRLVQLHPHPRLQSPCRLACGHRLQVAIARASQRSSLPYGPSRHPALTATVAAARMPVKADPASWTPHEMQAEPGAYRKAFRCPATERRWVSPPRHSGEAYDSAPDSSWYSTCPGSAVRIRQVEWRVNGTAFRSLLHRRVGPVASGRPAWSRTE